MLGAYTVQNVNNYELTRGAVHYYTILISLYCNFSYKFLYVLEFSITETSVLGLYSFLL